MCRFWIISDFLGEEGDEGGYGYVNMNMRKDIGAWLGWIDGGFWDGEEMSGYEVSVHVIRAGHTMICC